MRIVGLDVGERRIGVAVSDVTRTLARPLGVLRPTGLDVDAVRLSADEIGRLAGEEDGVASIVVGLPRRLDGTPTDMTRRVEQFARRLEARTALPVTLQDECVSFSPSSRWSLFSPAVLPLSRSGSGGSAFTSRIGATPDRNSSSRSGRAQAAPKSADGCSMRRS